MCFTDTQNLLTKIVGMKDFRDIKKNNKKKEQHK